MFYFGLDEAEREAKNVAVFLPPAPLKSAREQRKKGFLRDKKAKEETITSAISFLQRQRIMILCH